MGWHTLKQLPNHSEPQQQTMPSHPQNSRTAKAQPNTKQHSQTTKHHCRATTQNPGPLRTTPKAVRSGSGASKSNQGGCGKSRKAMVVRRVRGATLVLVLVRRKEKNTAWKTKTESSWTAVPAPRRVAEELSESAPWRPGHLPLGVVLYRPGTGTTGREMSRGHPSRACGDTR